MSTYHPVVGDDSGLRAFVGLALTLVFNEREYTVTVESLPPKETGMVRLRFAGGATTDVAASELWQRVNITAALRTRLQHGQHLEAIYAQLQRSIQEDMRPGRRCVLRRVIEHVTGRPHLQQRRFQELLSGSMRAHRTHLAQDLRLWHLFSGPFKSVYRTAVREFPQVIPLSVDWVPEFCPDIVRDIVRWDFWEMILDTHREGDHCWVPHHIHLTPSCQTHGPGAPAHRGKLVVADVGSSAAAVAADVAARWIAFIIRQMTAHWFPTTFSLENPLGSRFWQLPWIEDLVEELLLVRTTTDYCRLGSEARKSTVIAVSPVLARRGTPWVARCVPSGACGSLLATGSATKHVARPSNTLMDTAVPGGICSALNRTWVAHHSAPRHEARVARGKWAALNARGIAGGRQPLPYAVVPVSTILRMRLAWLQADFTGASDL